MPRGRLLRTKIKEAYKVGEAAEKGKLKAYQDSQKKKSYFVSLREHIGKMIDRVDPLESIAVLGTTLIIHDLIQGSEALISKISSPKNLAAWSTVIPLTDEERKKLEVDFNQPDIVIWLESFALAFFLVRNGAQVLQSGQNLLGFVTMMLA